MLTQPWIVKASAKAKALCEDKEAPIKGFMEKFKAMYPQKALEKEENENEQMINKKNSMKNDENT